MDKVGDLCLGDPFPPMPKAKLYTRFFTLLANVCYPLGVQRQRVRPLLAHNGHGIKLLRVTDAVIIAVFQLVRATVMLNHEQVTDIQRS